MNSGGNDLSENYKFKELGDSYDSMVERIKRLVSKFGHTALIVNRLDYYGNSIPVGAFCYAISFILCGFYRCKVYNGYDSPHSFIFSILLFFGGIGQITAGFLEFIKGRAFPSTIYITYGFYCISYYIHLIWIHKFESLFFDEIYSNYSNKGPICAFFGGWMFISLVVVIGSFKTNAFFLAQSIVTFVFFLLMCIGEGTQKDGVRRNAAGILEVISGFLSLYIFLNQLINEQFRRNILPAFPLNNENEIDITPENSTPGAN